MNFHLSIAEVIDPCFIIGIFLAGSPEAPFYQLRKSFLAVS